LSQSPLCARARLFPASRVCACESAMTPFSESHRERLSLVWFRERRTVGLVFALIGEAAPKDRNPADEHNDCASNKSSEEKDFDRVLGDDHPLQAHRRTLLPNRTNNPQHLERSAGGSRCLPNSTKKYMDEPCARIAIPRYSRRPVRRRWIQGCSDQVQGPRQPFPQG
jgi:hypothetical protein